MRALASLLITGLFCLSAASARAASGYGEDALGNLYRIDLSAHAATSLGGAGYYGSQPIVDITGLSAWDGSMFAVSDGIKALLKIDATTGSASIVGGLGLSGGGSGQYDSYDFGMAADCNGTFWLSSAVTGQLWRVNPATGATTLVGALGHGITGLVARGTTLFGAAGRGDNSFYRIDTATGAATRIGGFGSGVPAWVDSVAMSFDDSGTLWAVLNYIPPAPGSSTVPDWSDLATIDPVTGHVTIVGPITGPPALRGVGIRGFSFATSQCPTGFPPTPAAPADARWALALLALLLALAGWREHRRSA